MHRASRIFQLVVARLAACALAVALLPGLASAQQMTGITVTATGTTSSPPDRVELAVTVVGSAELAGEAATKYRGQRERLVEALNSLGVEGLKTRPGTMVIQSAGGTVRNQYGQMVPATNAGAFTVTEKVVIDLPAGDNTLDTITKIYDVGKDLGITFTPPKGASGSLVEPRFLKSDEAQAAAYEKAMERARAQASVLAKLSGRSLGEVASVVVTNLNATHTPVSSAERMMATWVAAVGMEMGVDASDIPEDASLTRQTTTATLQVRFELN